ncbi:DUF222 domain-containing protein [Kribbella sp. NPDC056861]|uniref:DUF222 domain-containing protein n=1 Tax=Kribbella sp. NPDC056861 TaxID=3154857 RepID=UPI00342349CF
MEIEQLPASCRLSDSDLLSTLDTVDAAVNALQAWSWQATADLERRGLAKELGAKDTTELLSLHHRRNPGELRRDLKLALLLPHYEAVTTALDTAVVSPAHAKEIITTLEKAPPTVPSEDLRFAEDQLIDTARILTPLELRAFGREVLTRLDTDGPEPTDPYQDETLWLKPVHGGIKFGGYLAAENAELLKTALYDLAKPHKTIDGDPDPRPHGKRHADALVTILEVATGATATPRHPRRPTPHRHHRLRRPPSRHRPRRRRVCLQRQPHSRRRPDPGLRRPRPPPRPRH